MRTTTRLPAAILVVLLLLPVAPAEARSQLATPPAWEQVTAPSRGAIVADADRFETQQDAEAGVPRKRRKPQFQTRFFGE